MPIERRSTTPTRFGPFEVDFVSGELRKYGTRVKLQEQPLQILEFLLAHPGDVVTREELRQRLWPADTFVDFDHGLYNAIKRLREALGDLADTPRFIETVPKRGYRFIGEVVANSQVAAQGDTAAVGMSEALSSPVLPPARTRSRKKRVLVLIGAGGLALFLFLLVGFNVGGRKPPEIHALAVLPLKNLSDDPGQEYFSYGMTEELITELSQIAGLKVISHTSVLQYEKGTKPLQQIAGELGVDGIVEGTVQRSGDRVRITVQLIYAPQDQHLWAATYDRDLWDALTVQSSVAAAIVEPIRSKTAVHAALARNPSASSSVQAMDDYLQGNYSIHRMASGDGHEGYEAAIKYFKKAISEDPNYAPAYLALANAYEANYDWRPDDIMPLEKAALNKALELNPGLAHAHLLKASINEGYDCDLSGAESEMNEALRLNPNLADAHALYSGYLRKMGRMDESFVEAKRAGELDPQGSGQLAILILNHQYDGVIEFQLRHLELHPNDGFAFIDEHGLINAYHFTGRYLESAEALQQAWTLFGFKEIGDGVGKAYAASGYAGALRYSARQMEHLYAEGKVWKPDMIASWYARAGDKEQALKWIGVEVADNNHCAFGLEHDQDFVSFHSDQRFQQLVKQSAPR